MITIEDSIDEIRKIRNSIHNELNIFIGGLSSAQKLQFGLKIARIEGIIDGLNSAIEILNTNNNK